MYSRFSYFALLALLLPSTVVYAQPAKLAPSSDWHLDYADTYCRIARQFGPAENANLFYIEQYEPTDRLTILIAGPAFDPSKLRKVTVRFGPDGGTSEKQLVTGASLEKFGSGLMVTNMTLVPDAEVGDDDQKSNQRWKPDPDSAEIRLPLAPARAAPIQWVEVLSKDEFVAHFDLGSLQAPVEALNACTSDLVRHWGFDPDVYLKRSRTVSPKTYPGSWVRAEDYPTKMLQNGAEGLVVFRLDLDEEGKATNCVVQQSTRPREFDQVVCRKIMAKARMFPALDDEGKPMKSFWLNSVRFEVPD